MLRFSNPHMPFYAAGNGLPCLLEDPSFIAQSSPSSYSDRAPPAYIRGSPQVVAALMLETPAAQKGHWAVMQLRREQSAQALAVARKGVAECPNSAVLRNDLLVLSSDHDVRLEAELLEDIKRDLVRPTDCAFNICINRAVASGRHKDALQYLVELHANGFTPDTYTQKALIPLFCQLERTARRNVQCATDRTWQPDESSGVPRTAQYAKSSDFLEQRIMTLKRQLNALMALPGGPDAIMRSYWLPQNHATWNVSLRRVFFEAMIKHASAESALAAHHDLAMHGGLLRPTDLPRLIQRWQYLGALRPPTAATSLRSQRRR